MCEILRLDAGDPDLSEWEILVDRIESMDRTARIGIIGKYVSLQDAYLSVAEALKHGGFHHGCQVEIEWIQAEEVEGLLAEGRLRELDGIVIPGGFGERGTEGKIMAAGYAREHEIPCLGLCLGLQMMTIEYARNVLGLAGANSSELDPTTPHPVIDLMETQRGVTDMGGTMRLGAYVAQLGRGLAGRRGLRHHGRVGAPPPPLRVQPPLPGPLRRDRLLVLRHVARRSARGVHRAPRPPVLGRHPGPPRAEEPAHPPGAAVPRAGRRRPRPGRGPLAAPVRPRRRTPLVDLRVTSGFTKLGEEELVAGKVFRVVAVHVPRARRRRVRAAHRAPPRRGGGRAAPRRRHRDASCASTGWRSSRTCSSCRPAPATSTARTSELTADARAGRGGRPGRRARWST